MILRALKATLQIRGSDQQQLELINSVELLGMKLSFWGAGRLVQKRPLLCFHFQQLHIQVAGRNLLSIALVLGICLAFVTTVDMRRIGKFNNGIGEILHKFLGGNTKTIVIYFAVLYMIITTFVTFLATTRYLFGLGDIYKGLEFMKVVSDVKVPINAVAFTLGTAALGILVNHTEYLVRAADFGLSSLLLLVAAAATKSVLSQGKIPWIEGATTMGLAGFMGLSFIH
jgi:hypothetical protein